MNRNILTHKIQDKPVLSHIVGVNFPEKQLLIAPQRFNSNVNFSFSMSSSKEDFCLTLAFLGIDR